MLNNAAVAFVAIICTDNIARITPEQISDTNQSDMQNIWPGLKFCLHHKGAGVHWNVSSMSMSSSVNGDSFLSYYDFTKSSPSGDSNVKSD
jgi:hypothetical protein